VKAVAADSERMKGRFAGSASGSWGSWL